MGGSVLSLRAKRRTSHHHPQRIATVTPDCPTEGDVSSSGRCGASFVTMESGWSLALNRSAAHTCEFAGAAPNKTSNNSSNKSSHALLKALFLQINLSPWSASRAGQLSDRL